MARTFTGIVSSDKGDKTIVVVIERRKTHPLYRKQYLDTNRLMAHDPTNEAKIGDRVLITECRPLSARKRFMLTKIIEKPSLSEEALTITKVEEPAKKSKVKEEPDQKELNKQ